MGWRLMARYVIRRCAVSAHRAWDSWGRRVVAVAEAAVAAVVPVAAVPDDTKVAARAAQVRTMAAEHGA